MILVHYFQHHQKEEEVVIHLEVEDQEILIQVQLLIILLDLEDPQEKYLLQNDPSMHGKILIQTVYKYIFRGYLMHKKKKKPFFIKETNTTGNEREEDN